MTITSTVTAVTHNGNGATTSFPFAFLIPSSTEIEVIFTSTAGVETVKTYTTHYTVSGFNDANGGTVIYPASGSPLATGEKLTIRRVTSVKQETDLVSGASFYAQVVEDALDHVVMIAQEQAEVIDRCVKVAVSSGIDPDTYMASIQASETAAAASASSASTSASSASTSASTASTAAATATTQASNASTSATNAASSASSASTSASNASASEAAAASSAASASTSASTATTQATNASTSASSASTSATNAANSATTASTQATNAANSASAASASATNAANSATSAATSAASLPNSSIGTGKVPQWSGSAWVGVSPGSGDVSGPASSTADAIVLFNGTGGKTIKDSTYTITAAGAALLDDASASAQRTTLGLGTAATATTGTAAGNVVVLDGSAKLPAVDGSQLTGIAKSLQFTRQSFSTDVNITADCSANGTLVGSSFSLTIPSSGKIVIAMDNGVFVRTSGAGSGSSCALGLKVGSSYFWPINGSSQYSPFALTSGAGTTTIKGANQNGFSAEIDIQFGSVPTGSQTCQFVMGNTAVSGYSDPTTVKGTTSACVMSLIVIQ